LTIAASVAVHVVLTAGLSWLALRAAGAKAEATPELWPSTPPASTAPIQVELPLVGEGLAIEEQPREPVGAEPPLPAGDAVAHPDTARAGRGGEVAATERALNMSEDVERVRFSTDLLNRLDRDQIEHLRVGGTRASWEDRRSTTHPGELTLVAIGTGSVRERRPLAATVPSRGSFASPLADSKGGSLGTSLELDAAREAARCGGDRQGARDDAPGAGLREAPPGVDHRAASPVASARPSVTRGPVAVVAERRSRPQDDADAQQEVATTVRSIVHASTAGGWQGEGAGGEGGGGDPGSGGTEADGFRARALGVQEGVYDYFTRDPRLLSYFRRVHAKIDPLWADAFPKSALLNLEQGTVILEFTILADGRAEVTWPPLRPSGVDEFDRNCAEAIRRASPFPPIPPALGSRLRIRAPFVASNPVVK
jgi:TonB family protein